MQTLHSIFRHIRLLFAFIILASLLACAKKETDNKAVDSQPTVGAASKPTKSPSQTIASTPKKEANQSTKPEQKQASTPTIKPATKTNAAHTTQSTQAEKLFVQVTVNSKLLEQSNKTYTVPNDAAITVKCSSPCSFSAKKADDTIAHDVEQSNDAWSTSKLNFQSETAQFKLAIQADGYKPIVLIFKLAAVVKTDASWSLDNHVWYRKESTQTVTHSNDYMLTMHNYNPNGSCAAQRKFACSFLAISVKGTLATGDFAIDPNFLTKAYKPPQGIRVNVHVTHGDNNALGEHYRPISGAIRVTKDAAGKYHYSTIGTVIVQRFNPKPGNAPFPETMRLRISNAH